MSTVRKEITINAPAAKVWAFLTEPAKLATWFIHADIAPRVGHRFVVAGSEGCGEHLCVVRESIPPRKLVYTFDMPKHNLETLVTFTLEESAGATKLTLIHTGPAQLTPAQAAHFAGFDGGWGTFLAKLPAQIAAESPLAPSKA